MWRTLLYTAVFLTLLILLIMLIRRYYWRLSYFVNAEFLEQYTPGYYGFSDTLEWKGWMERASNVCSNKRLVVCGMMRDCEHRIASVKARVEQLASVFGQVAVLIVENDSVDKTRERLLEWAATAGNNCTVQVLGCGIDAPCCKMNTRKTEGHPIEGWRMTKMALLRNIYLDHVKLYYADWDCLLVWDMDILGSLYVDGVMSSTAVLQYDASVDGVCSKGVYSWPGVNIYYDTLAHHETRFPDWIEGKGVVEQVYKSCAVSGGSLDLVKVQGCFSGATLYRLSSMLDKTYQSDGARCEHDSVSRLLNMVLNPTMINYILLNT